MQYRVETLKNSTGYLEKVRTLNKKSWPEFLLYGDTPSWERMYDELSEFVLLLIDSDDTLAGAGFTVAVSWNENPDDLPASIESIIVNGLETRGKAPNTLMAIAAVVDKGYRGQSLSAELLKQMRQLARHHGLQKLLVPVRPTWKARYPLQRIESYAGWRRADGLFYDPWLRTHERLGAKLIKCVESTYKVEGSIEDWQNWTGMIFPETGRYIVEGALQPVEIDIESDVGIYHDPNVWMQHKVQ